jgi:predicted enzyme related to lactoylglutathione lyase
MAANNLITRSIIKAAISFLLLIHLVACGLTLPPITEEPTGQQHIGKFVWFDLLTDDVAAAKKFYADIFAWEFEGSENGYTKILHKGDYIGGIIYSERLEQKVSEAQWLSYLSVPDVDRATEYLRQNGGKIIREPMDLDERGRASVVADPQGAVFVMLSAKDGDPEDVRPKLGEWLWSELITTNSEDAASFYTSLVGYTQDAREAGEGRMYYVMKYDDLPRAGILKSPWENVRPNWLPYIRVEDPAMVTDRVPKIGGKVILEPDPGIRKGSVAVIADPTGAVLAVQKWPM